MAARPTSTAGNWGNWWTQYLFLTPTVSPDGRTTYHYDDADLLVKIERRTATGAPQGFSEFVYDYASRKAISREWVYQNGAFVKTEEKRRVFDGMDVVQERNAQNQVTAQLVRDGNISGILSRTTAVGASFYGYDGNGNVTLLTDASGADVAHYRYDAWGNTLEAVGPRASENPYHFSTKEVHAASGLYDFGYRFYSPGMGRWINRDPLGEAGGVNLYAMVGNSPVNGVDEYGLDPYPCTHPNFNGSAGACPSGSSVPTKSDSSPGEKRVERAREMVANPDVYRDRWRNPKTGADQTDSNPRRKTPANVHRYTNCGRFVNYVVEPDDANFPDVNTSAIKTYVVSGKGKDKWIWGRVGGKEGLKPGDVLWKNGHVAIYGGQETVGKITRSFVYDASLDARSGGGHGPRKTYGSVGGFELWFRPRNE